MPAAIARKAAALAILFGFVVMLANLLWQILVVPVAIRQAEIGRLADLLADARVQVVQAASLRRDIQSASATLHGLGATWPEGDRVRTAAIIQDVLRAAAQSAGGHVVSSAAAADDAADTDIVVRARIEGTLVTLRQVLDAVHVNRPRLFVDTLSVTTPGGPSTPTRPQMLSFEVALHGFTAADARP